jgi:hypothetical protein
VRGDYSRLPAAKYDILSLPETNAMTHISPVPIPYITLGLAAIALLVLMMPFLVI